jgi:hypothetical protein
MTGLDLRPLSLGDILDRTFSLYRRHFLLFLGITGIPQLVVLALSLSQTALRAAMPQVQLDVFLTLAFLVLYIPVAVVAYLFSQGGAIFAVSDIYLGRSITIMESLRRVWEDFGSLLGVIILNGIIVVAGFIFLIVPGIYLMCRLLVCVPAALIEKRGPRDSLSRSFNLTRDSAGRAFVILLLYLALVYGAILLMVLPFSILLGISAANGGANSPTAQVLVALTQVGSSAASILVTPILLIATSVFYYDLRVRKEAFDLQFMMDPNPQKVPGSSGDIPSILA